MTRIRLMKNYPSWIFPSNRSCNTDERDTVVSTTTDGRYAVHFYVGAVFSVFRLWFDEGMLESADEISELIYRFINNDTAMDFLVVPGEDK